MSSRPAVPGDAAGSIRVVQATDVITALDLEGEFDISTAPKLTEHAERVLADGKHLIINLRDSTFIDSSIIHALFAADAAAKGRGSFLVLELGTQAIVERVIRLTGADRQIATVPTRAEAVRFIDKQLEVRTSRTAPGPC
jgi:anti-sigma B factor antagonist